MCHNKNNNQSENPNNDNVDNNTQSSNESYVDLSEHIKEHHYVRTLSPTPTGSDDNEIE